MYIERYRSIESMTELMLELGTVSLFFFFSSRRRHTRWPRDWSSDVCSSDLPVRREGHLQLGAHAVRRGHEDRLAVARRHVDEARERPDAADDLGTRRGPRQGRDAAHRLEIGRAHV